MLDHQEAFEDKYKFFLAICMCLISISHEFLISNKGMMITFSLSEILILFWCITEEQFLTTRDLSKSKLVTI